MSFSYHNHYLTYCKTFASLALCQISSARPKCQHFSHFMSPFLPNMSASKTLHSISIHLGRIFLAWIARGLRLQENFGNLTSIHDETMKAPADSRGLERLCLVQWYHLIIFNYYTWRFPPHIWGGIYVYVIYSIYIYYVYVYFYCILYIQYILILNMCICLSRNYAAVLRW